MTDATRRRPKFGIEALQPQTFAELIGQKKIVDELRSLALKQERPRGVILYGPDGVGKHAIALVLARAFLCDELSSDGDACGACQACLLTSPDGGFGVAIFDASTVTDESYQQVAVKEPAWGSLLGGRAVIMDRVDTLAPSRFDRILSVLEEPKTNSRFVLIATDIERVRRTGQSRCASYRLRPLDHADATDFVEKLLVLNGCILNAQTFQMVLAAGRGLPTKLTEAVETVIELRLADQKQIMAALDLDWPSEIVAHWRSVLTTGRPVEELLGRPAGLVRAQRAKVRRPSAAYEEGAQEAGSSAIEDAAWWPERLRWFLLYFQLRGLGEMASVPDMDPAFEFVDISALDELARLWLARAKADGIASRTAFERLTHLAGTDDYELGVG